MQRLTSGVVQVVPVSSFSVTRICEIAQTMAGTSISPVAHLYADDQLHGTLTVSGYGASVVVKSSHLKITDGIGRARRERRIPRQPKSVRRLVSDSTTGYMSFDAMKWLHDAGIPWAQITSAGDILAMSSPAREDAQLLRLQVQAKDDQAGIDIARFGGPAPPGGLASQHRDQTIRLGTRTCRRRHRSTLLARRSRPTSRPDAACRTAALRAYARECRPRSAIGVGPGCASIIDRAAGPGFGIRPWTRGHCSRPSCRAAGSAGAPIRAPAAT